MTASNDARRISAIVAAVVWVVIVAGACARPDVRSDSASEAPAVTSLPTSTVESVTTETPTTAASSTVPPTTAAPTTTSTTAPPPPLPPAETIMRVGDSGPDVAALQNRLVELGYWLGDPAGTYGTTTQQAVMALQKVQGIGRDGAVGPETRAALSVAQRPVARSAPGSGRVMEVDLARQVIFVVDGGVVTLALNTSTGRSGWSTPSGRFAIGRTVNGTDTGPYGALYRPRYFYRGIAVHGSPSIPGYPASHGCTRVSNAAIDMLWAGEALPKGTSVWVY